MRDDGERHVLGAAARRQHAVHRDAHRFRLALQQALRRQHMADLGGADAERQRPERAVGAGVAVPADDGLAELGQAKLRPDDVHDAAARIAEAEQFDVMRFRVLAISRVDLLFRLLGVA